MTWSVRHRQQALASDVASDKRDGACGLGTHHAVVKRAVRLGAGLCADGSSGRVELVGNRTARPGQRCSGKLVTALTAASAIRGQIVVDQAAAGYGWCARGRTSQGRQGGVANRRVRCEVADFA